MENIKIQHSFGISYRKIDANEMNLLSFSKKLKANLQAHKYIVFKNQAESAEDFLAFSDAIGNDFVSYKGGAYVREKVKKNNNTLLSVTGGSGMKMAVPMHGEMHYKKIKPPMLWFCCISAPLAHGETTLCDAEALYDSLSIEARTLFDNQNIQYIRTYDEERWKGVFQTDNIEDIIPFFKANKLDYEIDENNVLITRYTCSAIHTDSKGIKYFINNILPICYQEKTGMQNNVVRFENGDPIPQNIIDELTAKTESQKVNVTWEPGDIVLIDNNRAMHGRNKITCDNRNIIVRMSD